MNRPNRMMVWQSGTCYSIAKSLLESLWIDWLLRLWWVFINKPWTATGQCCAIRNLTFRLLHTCVSRPMANLNCDSLCGVRRLNNDRDANFPSSFHTKLQSGHWLWREIHKKCEEACFQYHNVCPLISDSALSAYLILSMPTGQQITHPVRTVFHHFLYFCRLKT